jgi:hypothetical protein
MLRAGLRGLNLELDRVTKNAQRAGEAIGGEQFTEPERDDATGETINTPAKRREMRMGFAGGSTVGTAAKILKEAGEAKKSSDKTIEMLEKMLGDIPKHQEAMFRQLAEAANENYKGITLFKGIAEVLDGMNAAMKSPRPGQAMYELMKRLDNIIAVINKQFLGSLRGVNRDTFLAFRDSVNTSNGDMP